MGPTQGCANMSSRSSVPFSHAVHHPRQHGRPNPGRQGGTGNTTKPAAAYRQRLGRGNTGLPFNAPETWHESSLGIDDEVQQSQHERCRIVIQPAGMYYVHPVTEQEVRQRLGLLPLQFTQNLEVVQFSRMSRKRQTFPCYGMQWGHAVYLYPIEKNLVEQYARPPKPAQQIEASMFGAQWQRIEDGHWTLTWTAESLKDFYLNNVLIHEIGHLNDSRNTSYRDRERFANWFAIEYGYRATRGR
jgi:hypothetical protein